MARLTLEMIGADFIRRRITPLHNKGRPAWDFRNAADIMRLRTGLKHNLTVMGHSWYCRRLFQLEEYAENKVRSTGKATKSGKVVKGPLFGLPSGVVPLSNNSWQAEILAMMPPFNTHGLDPAWVEPPAHEVEEFFTNLVEELDHEEPRLIQDTTQEELNYIVTRVMEAEHARLADEADGVENKADAAAEE